MDVVITTANNLEGKHSSVYYTIRSILAQDIEGLRVIVSANSNYLEMKQFISEKFGEMVIVVDATKVSNNISYARNVGASQGSNAIIVFMDDDVVLSRDNILRKVSIKMKGNDFLCGAHRYWVNPGWEKLIRKEHSINYVRSILRSKSFLPKSIDRLKGSLVLHDYSFIGHFGAIKRSIFNRMGGYDEGYIEWTYQDTDLMMRLCHEGYNYDLMHTDGIKIFHLSHPVDKSKTREINRERYYSKQSEYGIKFNVDHFFGVFNDNSFELIKKIDE